MGVLKKIFSNNGDVTIKGSVAYGHYNSFPIAVEKATGNNDLLIKMFVNIDHKHKEKLNENLSKVEERLKKKLKNFNNIKSDGKIIILELGSIVSFKADNNARTAIEEVVEVLQKYECKPGCECCGKDVGTSFFMLNGSVHNLCDDCSKEEEHRAKKEALEQSGIKVNIPYGMLYAFIGTLVVSLIYLILLRFNLPYYSVILPLVPFFCFAFGGKRVGKIGAIFTAIILLVSFFFVTKIGLGWRISADNNSHFFETMKILGSFRKQSDTSGLFYKYFFLGYGLSALSTIAIAVLIFLNTMKNKLKKL